MSLGKKIYASLWAVTGALLVALIVMFVSLNDKYNKTIAPKDGWSIKIVGSASDKGLPSYGEYKVTALKDAEAGMKFSDGTDATFKKGDKVDLTTAKKVEEIRVYFDMDHYTSSTETTPAAALYATDEWKATPTSTEKNAINATATVGALFGVSLIGTVFTTVGVSMYEKKRGGKK